MSIDRTGDEEDPWEKAAQARPPPLEQAPLSMVQETPAMPLEQTGFQEERTALEEKSLRLLRTCYLFHYVESMETIFLR